MHRAHPRTLAVCVALVIGTFGGCAQGPPRAGLVEAMGSEISRDVLGVANASDIAVSVWLATEGSPLESDTPRWFVDGPWKLPPGSLWLHGQHAHEQTVSIADAAATGAPPALRIGHGRAFVCICYADDPGAPRTWAEITRGGLGIKRPMLSPELVFLLMPRSMDEPLEVVPPLPAIGGVATESLPESPRQASETHNTIAGLRMPLRRPAIVLNPQIPTPALGRAAAGD